jgi:ubiquinone/menaquinone biosynthesis C-methylase UbiE/uncharacterized protein YbaR (Trm112 family)
MRTSLTQVICCPSCKGNVVLSRRQKTRGEEIIEGELECVNCHHSYDIQAGVPKMVVDVEKRKQIAERYGFEWAKRAEESFEDDTLYGKTEEEEINHFFTSFGIQPSDLSGKKVLDAGCGCGRLTRMLGPYCGEVFGMDVSLSINQVYDYCRVYDNINIMQADVLKLPFRANYFDFVWCNGVISYTQSGEEAFQSLSPLVKPGGRLFVRVFSNSNLTAAEKLSKIFWFSHKIPKQMLFYLCYVLAIPWSITKYLLHRKHKSLKTNAFHLFDTLAHPFTRHSEDEIQNWFKRQGFSVIRSRDEGGVAVSGIKE